MNSRALPARQSLNLRKVFIESVETFFEPIVVILEIALGRLLRPAVIQSYIDFFWKVRSAWLVARYEFLAESSLKKRIQQQRGLTTDQSITIFTKSQTNLKPFAILADLPNREDTKILHLVPMAAGQYRILFDETEDEAPALVPPTSPQERRPAAGVGSKRA